MGVYIFVFAWMYLSQYLFKMKTAEGRKRYCVLMALILICVYGFRDPSLGMNDVELVYMPMLDNVRSMTWIELFNYYPVTRGNMLQVVSKIYMDIFGYKYFWLFLSGIPFVVCSSYAIYKYSKYPVFTYFMMFGMYIYLTNMFLIRHSIAMAILILAYGCILENKPVKFILLVLLATSFHTTAIVFCIAYPLTKLKFDWKIYLGSILCAYYIIYNGRTLIVTLFRYIQNDYYSLYSNSAGASGLMYFWRYFVLFLVMVMMFLYNSGNIHLRKLKVRKTSLYKKRYFISTVVETDQSLKIMMCICVVVMGSTALVSDLYRIGMFFGVIGIIGVSNELANCHNKNLKNVVVFVLYVVYGIYIYNGLYAANLAPYKSWL